MIDLRCGMCDHLFGSFTKKELPKSFVCPKCKTGQQPTITGKVSYTNRRNYPEGFFDQN